MDTITQTFLNNSVLEVSLIKITNPTADGFDLAIESRVTKTGPLGATMSPLTVEMIGPKGTYGHLALPEVKTSSSGVNVPIASQKIDIVSMDAFKAFVKSLMLDDSLVMKLDNGKGTIKALGMKGNIVYKKNVNLKGMKGPKTEILSTKMTGEGTFENRIKIYNPSPVEIDLGDTLYEFRDANGEVVGVQHGKIYLTRGNSEFTVTGNVLRKGSIQNGKAKLASTGSAGENWLCETNKYMDMDVYLTPELEELFKA